MAVFKCKMCGGTLVLTEGNPIAECEYCGSIQTVPSADNEKMLNLFTRANRLRANCEFDKAFGVYQVLVADFPGEPEAYWGLVLCKYGIEYVDDPATGKKIPTCHRSSFDSILEDPDLAQAVDYADPVARKLYREEAKQIDQILKGIQEVSSGEAPYDIFICYKETAADGQRTIDSTLAQDIYDKLVEKNYRVFFSRITLEDKLGQAYEPYIFAALNSAKVMLAIGTQYDYFDAVWVRNEWSRYLKLMETDKQKHLIPCYKDIDAYDMPKEFSALQAQDLGKVGAIQDLLRGIDKLIRPTGGATTGATHSVSAEPQLERGFQLLADGEWEMANSRFDLALVAEPDCARAYFGKLLAERKLRTEEDLEKEKVLLENSVNFRPAQKCADKDLMEKLEYYSKKVKKNVARKKRRAAITAVIIALVALATAWVLTEVKYRNLESAFLSGNTGTQEELLEMSWYKKPSQRVNLFLGLLNYTECSEYVQSYINTEGRIISLSKDEVWITSASEVFPFEKVILEEGVTEIPVNAFSGRSVVEVVLPSTLKTIGSSAFMNSDLGSINLPDGLVSIGGGAFSNCTRLSSLTLPDSLVSIGDNAFSFSGLTSIRIPESVTEFGLFVFKNCESLQHVYIEANEAPSTWAYAWERGIENKIVWGSNG